MTADPSSLFLVSPPHTMDEHYTLSCMGVNEGISDFYSDAAQFGDSLWGVW